MNIETNLLEDYVDFVASTKKQNIILKIIINLFVVIISLFSFFVLF